MTDIAIAHWAETCNGGGERVAWALARQFVHAQGEREEVSPLMGEVQRLHRRLDEADVARADGGEER